MEQTYSSVIEKEFCKLVDDRLAELKDEVCNVQAVTAIQIYTYKVGMLNGLASAKGLMEEASELVHKRNRGI